MWRVINLGTDDMNTILAIRDSGIDQHHVWGDEDPQNPAILVCQAMYMGASAAGVTQLPSVHYAESHSCGD